MNVVNPPNDELQPEPSVKGQQTSTQPWELPTITVVELTPLAMVPDVPVVVPPVPEM